MAVVNIANYRAPQFAKLKSPMGLMIFVEPTGIAGAAMEKLVAKLEAILVKHDAAFQRCLAEAPYVRRSPAVGPVLLPGRHCTTNLTTTRSVRITAILGARVKVRWILGMEAFAIGDLIVDVKAAIRDQSEGRAHD